MAARFETERLVLRPFRREDQDAFRDLAGDFLVSRMTSDIPHPLDAEQARQWLLPARGEQRFAIEEGGQLVGGAGYFERTGRTAEVGFWLGRAFWGRGLATEAVAAVIRHAFTEGGFDRLTSSHFVDNPASARVLAKLGFEASGRCPIRSEARGEDVEAVTYVLTRERAKAVLGAVPQRRAGRLGSIFERFHRGA